MLLNESQRFLAVARRQHVVAVTLKNENFQPTHTFFVFDQKDRLAATSPDAGIGCVGCGSGNLYLHGGEVEFESRADVRLAVDLQMPAALLDDAKDHSQSQPR